MAPPSVPTPHRFRYPRDRQDPPLTTARKLAAPDPGEARHAAASIVTAAGGRGLIVLPALDLDGPGRTSQMLAITTQPVAVACKEHKENNNSVGVD